MEGIQRRWRTPFLQPVVDRVVQLNNWEGDISSQTLKKYLLVYLKSNALRC